MGTVQALPLRCLDRTHVDAGTQRAHPTTGGKAPSAHEVTFRDRRPWTASGTCRSPGSSARGRVAVSADLPTGTGTPGTGSVAALPATLPELPPRSLPQPWPGRFRAEPAAGSGNRHPFRGFRLRTVMCPAPTWARQKLSRSAAFAAHMWTPGPKEPTRPPAARHLPRERSPSAIAARGRLPGRGGQAAATSPGPDSTRRAHPLPAPRPHDGDHSSATTITITTTTRRRGDQQRKHHHSSTAPTSTDETAPLDEHQPPAPQRRRAPPARTKSSADEEETKPDHTCGIEMHCGHIRARNDLPDRPLCGNTHRDESSQNLPCVPVSAAQYSPCAAGQLLRCLSQSGSHAAPARHADR